MTRDSTGRSLFLLASIGLVITTTAYGQRGDETGVASDSPKPTAVDAVVAPSPSMDELANAVFTGIQDAAVQLVDGRWEGEPFVEGGASAPVVGLVQGFHLNGDLTGDGLEETAVILWTSSGGSGTFDYLAVAGRRDGMVANLGTAELGDRVQVRQGRIADGKIELDVIQAGPEDAACCPTEMATRTWEMGSDGLVETASETTGTLSMAVLRGPEWVLTDLAWNESAPVEPEVTLVFDKEKISGVAGCNGYFAVVEASGELPACLSIEAIGATRKMCLEEIVAVEDRFLKQLAAVSSYSFLAGKLALSWQTEDSGGVMLFSPRHPSGLDS